MEAEWTQLSALAERPMSRVYYPTTPCHSDLSAFSFLAWMYRPPFGMWSEDMAPIINKISIQALCNILDDGAVPEFCMSDGYHKQDGKLGAYQLPSVDSSLGFRPCMRYAPVSRSSITNQMHKVNPAIPSMQNQTCTWAMVFNAIHTSIEARRHQRKSHLLYRSAPSPLWPYR